MAGNPLWNWDYVSNSRLGAGAVGVVKTAEFISGPRRRLGDGKRRDSSRVRSGRP